MLRSVHWHPCLSVPHVLATASQRAPKTRRRRNVTTTPPYPPGPPRARPGSLTHSASGTQRNWRTHGNIFSQNRQRQIPGTLERNVRTFRNMRLRDAATARGLKARKHKEPKEYPLHKGDWSSCDESNDGESSEDDVRCTMGF